MKRIFLFILTNIAVLFVINRSPLCLRHLFAYYPK